LSRKGTEWDTVYEYSRKKLLPRVEVDNNFKTGNGNCVRIITEVESDKITVSPSVPDMPVIVHSADEILIPQKQSAVFYVEIPLVLRFKIQSNPDIFLHDIPSEQLSKTWYGDISGGILSYSLNTVFLTEVPEKIPPSSAVSRIVVSNKSKYPFSFTRIAVYVQNFNIYEGSNKMLWTDNSDISYLNNDELKILIEKKPAEAEKIVYQNPNYIQNKNLISKGLTVMLQSVTGV